MGGGFTRVGLSAISAAGFDIKCRLGWEMWIVGAIRSWIGLIEDRCIRENIFRGWKKERLMPVLPEETRIKSCRVEVVQG
jgi:hypothetical protein